ncbi:threonine--tRNA ligase [Buchnera aphidicola]|uniref:Threonine--tRNA ligase n=1 Tax=Buchnera aphidicola subsp. Melaphis rhois TaxID=118103 RepID=A0A4D6YAT1_BUCMH|nr:threonine--tRNA ligase [Buchnera aphidicola]QCI23154.1 threonine--tRNA ligase [Buchnera aphidicola (Melaphis rhois)]
MPVITMFDGQKITYKNAISVLDIVKNVSPELVKNCCFGYVNNVSVNKNTVIDYDANIRIIYDNDPIFLNIIRSACIGVLGYAVKELWPDSKIGYSSITENGFYCDIDIDFAFTDSDLNLLEMRMLDISNRRYDVDVKQVTWNRAYEIFENCFEIYKLSILKRDFNIDQLVSLCFYQKYVDFKIEIPVPNVSFCRYFKLQKFSGVYWNRKKENKILQRIYGTAWSTLIELKNHLEYIDQYKIRDHRRISKILDLYHIQEDSPGMIFWHHNGMIIFRELKKFIREKLEKYQYQEVQTPLIMNKKIWKNSGHLDNYQHLMFMTASESSIYGIKPMNCPGHVQIFNNTLHSYRDLPIRISEFGSCHRNEPSGSLHGLMRIRHFTQDDAHIFCRRDQVRDEISNCIKMIYDVYEIFGFKKSLVKLSTRPDNRIGNDAIWDQAENDLAMSLKENNILFEYQKGEGAFYGPKIELSLLDSLGRIWQCATIQLDFYLPMNLGSFYVDKNNEKKVPIIIHRAILGSLERFIGILIENYSGNFPTWLSPVQVVCISVNNNHIVYVKDLFNTFFSVGIRVKLDIRNQKVGFKIREQIIKKIPYIVICGDKEVVSNKITFRTRSGKHIQLIDIQYFIKKLQQEIVNRNLYLLEE